MDLVDCDDVSEAGILRELQHRFHRQVIYSSIGPILLALNPYAHIEGLYHSTILQDYIHRNQDINTERYEEEKLFARSKGVESSSPHVWMVPYRAYQQLRYEQRPQAIVISGESGGKYMSSLCR